MRHTQYPHTMKTRTIAITSAAIITTIATIAAIRISRNPARRIIKAAQKYVGIHEIGSNGGWDNADFQQKMTAVGWKNGEAWCAYFVKMLLLEISKGKANEYFKKTCSANTQITWNNFQTPSKYHEVSQKPRKGSLIIYQGISDPSQGHVEIYLSKGKNGGYNVISGNVSFPGGGQGVVQKERTATEMQRQGLKILGYINIKKLK